MNSKENGLIGSHVKNEMVPSVPCNFNVLLSEHPRVVTGEKISSTVADACRKRRLKWVSGAWGYNWAIQSPGDINMETWSSRLGVGRGADDPTPEKVNS
jgi:hypothetical protein